MSLIGISRSIDFGKRRSHGSNPWWIIALCFAFTILEACPSSARSKEFNLELGDEYSGPRRTILEHDGISGIWFRFDVAREVLSSLQELQVRIEEIQLLDDLLVLRSEQTDRLREMVDIEKIAAEQALEALAIAERRAAHAEEMNNAWWRNPGFWVSMGVIATLALEVVSIVLLKYLYIDD